MSFRTALSSNVLALAVLTVAMPGASATAGAGHAFAQTPAPAPHHRVLFALTSPEEADWNLTLGNIRNLLKVMPDAEIEVVAYGPGIMMIAKTTPVAAEIQKLQEQHVKFVACENAMRARKFTLADLVDGVTSVPAGIAEVVTKQEQGWTYIKAGR
jgi:intracellular sulfur oxidation DsrE/DsrF family protein